MEEGGRLISASIFLLLFLFLFKFMLKRQAKHRNLPPSPPALPLIGHLHLIKQPLHRSLHKLTDKYGHIFLLHLGTRNVLLEEHRKNRRSMSAGNDRRNMTLIDVMLDLQEREPEFYTHETIKGVILAMLVAGTETSATTMEWALSLLLNHPKAMNKTRVEIDTYVGQDQLLKESNIGKLKYLQNMITETLRLYPVAPLLIPHESSNDCKVCGFDIPRGTMLLVNLWTLHRDTKLWVDPTRFVPERFEGEDGGKMYNMIPFGIGRRACPGTVLAKRVMGHALGALIQSFEWDRNGGEEINMTEGLGITIPKVKPLVALYRPRQGMIKVLSNI